MTDALAWMGVFLGFAALGVAGAAMTQLTALRREVEKLKEGLRQEGGQP